VKKRLEVLSFIAALIMLFGIIASLSSLAQSQQNSPDTQHAQPPSQQAPDTQAPQQPAQPGQAKPGQATPGQAPDQAQQPDQGGAKEFVGTVVKQGDKYVFQDATTGTTYDIDHQDEVKKFEGKKVRVHGTLDASTKTIHVR
jgi:uncharacterized protein YdeI (BOF family)